jgi:ketosteroid isomerase-like protein
MSQNTATVERYLDGFRKSDHAQILSCLTDDIEWTVFGAFHLTGKQAYDAARVRASPARPASASSAWSSRTTS